MTFDLHNCETLVFSDWSEEVSYLERVTMPDRDQATAYMAEEVCIDPDDLDLQPIFLRWESAPAGKPFQSPDGFEYDGGWSECAADHPDAVPFWRDGP